LVRNSPALCAYQREIFARFDQGAALGDETGAPPTPSCRSSPAAVLISVFRVNLAREPATRVGLAPTFVHNHASHETSMARESAI
jgi:hypothetical protein